MSRRVAATLSLTTIFTGLLFSTGLAFTEYGDSPPSSYPYRVYHAYLSLLPFASLLWGIPYFLSKRRTTKPFYFAVGILMLFGIMFSIWEIYAWGIANSIPGFLLILLMIIIGFYLVRSSDDPDKSRKVFTAFFFPVAFCPLLAASSWFTFYYMSPTDTMTLALLLTIILCVLFMGKQRSFAKRMTDAVCLAVVGLLSFRSLSDLLFDIWLPFMAIWKQ